ncbi:ABC-2 family transporter protein, partial [Streptococcus pneumoniae]
KDVFFNVGGLMLISLVFFVISLKLWDKGLDSYESAGS